MELNTLRIIYTLLSLAFFVGVCFWAYSSHNKKELEEAAMLPFQDRYPFTSHIILIRKRSLGYERLY